MLSFSIWSWRNLHSAPDQSQDHGGWMGGELLHDGALLRTQLQDTGGGLRAPQPRRQEGHGRPHPQRLPGDCVTQIEMSYVYCGDISRKAVNRRICGPNWKYPWAGLHCVPVASLTKKKKKKSLDWLVNKDQQLYDYILVRYLIQYSFKTSNPRCCTVK